MGESQARKYQLTINNPLPNFDHEHIKELLTLKFPTFEYCAMADEVGSKGHTPHTHVFVCFSSAVRHSTIKRYFPTAHIEACKGSVKDNLDYIRKTGKWAETEKSATALKETFEEIGSCPQENKGKNKFYEDMYHMIVEEGLSNSEIIRINKDYIGKMDDMTRLRTTFLQDKYKGSRRLNLKRVYIFGSTGSGKSRSILDEYGDENVYRVTDYQHPFDQYGTQDVLVFEEFRSGLPISDMLNYLDIYPLSLKARYANKYACYNYVFLSTNVQLEAQYPELQRNDPETWGAFLRRIDEIREFTGKEIIVYHSVADYYKAKHIPLPASLSPKPKPDKDGFCQITINEVPFENQKSTT